MCRILIILFFLISKISLSQNLQLNNEKFTMLLKTDTLNLHKKIFQTEIIKTTALPTILIGYGVLTIGKRGFFVSSYDIYNWRQKHYPNFHTKIDDYFRYVPLASMYTLDMLNVKSKNNFINQTVLYFLSYELNDLITYNTKKYSHIQRPDKSNYFSFPSSHVSTSFVAAEVFHQEFKDESIWFTIAGYTVASSVGAFRILNNNHWYSDVLVGAGVGILSTKFIYFAYPKIKKKIFRKKIKHNI